jgi:hypothetical protein
MPICMSRADRFAGSRPVDTAGRANSRVGCPLLVMCGPLESRESAFEPSTIASCIPYERTLAVAAMVGSWWTPVPAAVGVDGRDPGAGEVLQGPAGLLRRAREHRRDQRIAQTRCESASGRVAERRDVSGRPATGEHRSGAEHDLPCATARRPAVDRSPAEQFE